MPRRISTEYTIVIVLAIFLILVPVIILTLYVLTRIFPGAPGIRRFSSWRVDPYAKKRRDAYYYR